MRQKHIQHGPRRRWYAPWSVVCRCGLGSSPCYAARMLAEQASWRTRSIADWDGPSWGGPTLQLSSLGRPSDRPLLTRGQAARGNGHRR